MWDLKLILLDVFLSFSLFLNDLLFTILNFIDPLFQNGFFLFTSKVVYQFSQNMTVFFAIKFSFCIAFLILIRGGTPRYRYDYLTKLGWLKFLTLVILIFSSSLILFFLF